MKKTHRALTVASLLASMFMAAMEMTIVSTAMPSAVGALGGVYLYAWVFTAYMLVSTITVLIFGKLADLYGRKPVLLVGTVLFLLGSLACGFAPSMGLLIAARAVQGLGAGAMQPIGMTIIGDLFDVHERAKVQGAVGAVWGTAGLIGPLLGGLIVAKLSWRWVFFINLPFGLLSMAILWVAFHERIERKRQRLDLAGAALLTLSVVTILWAAKGNYQVQLFALPLSGLMLYLFLRVERRAEEPLLPLDLFRQRVMVTASAAGGLVGAGMFAMTTYVPLYVQGVLGGTPIQAGSVITPMVIGWPIAATLGGWLLPRIGFRPLVRAGMLLAAFAAVGVAWSLRPGTNLQWCRLMSGLYGAGIGFANTALIVAVQTRAAWNQRGVATASILFFRTIGGTLAVGLLGGFLAAALQSHGSAMSASVDELLGHGRAALSAQQLSEMSSALQEGLEPVLTATALIAIVAFAVSLLFPKLGLKKKPGARAQEPVPSGRLR